jgi:hypothetical protein
VRRAAACARGGLVPPGREAGDLLVPRRRRAQDRGLRIAARAESTRHTQAGTLLGTPRTSPRSRSPARTRRRRRTSTRSARFCTSCLTGRPPYSFSLAGRARSACRPKDRSPPVRDVEPTVAARSRGGGDARARARIPSFRACVAGELRPQELAGSTDNHPTVPAASAAAETAVSTTVARLRTQRCSLQSRSRLRSQASAGSGQDAAARAASVSPPAQALREAAGPQPRALASPTLALAS